MALSTFGLGVVANADQDVSAQKRSSAPPEKSEKPFAAPTGQAEKQKSVTFDSAKFLEGAKQTITLEYSGDLCAIWVEGGWIHASRQTQEGLLDWHIILAHISGAEVPGISLEEGFELSYRDGRYFIRDDGQALRSFRERTEPNHCMERTAMLGKEARLIGFGNRKRPWPRVHLEWDDDQWIFVGSGPDDQRFDAIVRLTPLDKEWPESGLSGGSPFYTYYGYTWHMDDGQVLAAYRTPQSEHKADLTRQRIEKNLPGAVLPEIKASAWLNTNDDLSWGKLKGKVVLLGFWGAWCGSSVRELPRVQQLASKYANRGLVVIGVHCLQDGEKCKEYLDTNAISFPVAIDSGTTTTDFGVDGCPTMLLIDKAGKVVGGYRHEIPKEDVIEKLLKN
jgi:thiol-disulfide isomerase/thioredoxin